MCVFCLLSLTQHRVLQSRLCWEEWASIFTPVQCVIYSTESLSLRLNPSTVSHLLKWEQASAGDICLAYNRYPKCFSNSIPSQTSLPFSTLPNYQWNEAGTLSLPQCEYFPQLRRVERIPLWACSMEASSQSSSQQVLWKDVSQPYILCCFDFAVYLFVCFCCIPDADFTCSVII